MRALFTALFLGSATIASCATQPVADAVASSPQALASELLETDRAFAAASAQTDSISGITAQFANDVTMYAIPVAGFATDKAQAVEKLRAAIGEGAANSKTGWTPVRAGISADGQHGFTFGYMTTEEPGKPVWVGKYAAYWVKRPEGWRVAIYKRIPREEGDVSLAVRPPLVPNAFVPVSKDKAAMEEAQASLAAREKAFSDDSQTIGLRAGFIKYGRADAVNGNGGAEFLTGNQAIGEAHPDGPSPLRWEADHTLVASSGDLGINWGMLHRTGPTPPGRLAEIPYFTIWYRASKADPWLYVVE